MNTIGAHRSTAANRCACALIAVVIALAGAHAWRVTSALTWPYDPDLFRDIAAAETMLGGDLPGTDKGRYVREDPRHTDYRPARRILESLPKKEDDGLAV